jgi:hypothetical protein
VFIKRLVIVDLFPNIICRKHIINKKNSISLLGLVKIWLPKNFSMKDMRETTYIIEIKIYKDRSKRLLGLPQSTYIDKMIK